MAVMNFGGVEENVMTREEFPLEKAREILKDETIAVIGYGVQGPGQSMNLRDNGFNVIVGQRKNSKSWDKAVADGWVQDLLGLVQVGGSPKQIVLEVLPFPVVLQIVYHHRCCNQGGCKAQVYD